MNLYEILKHEKMQRAEMKSILGNRIGNALCRGGIKSMNDLRTIVKEQRSYELMEIRDIGPVSYREIMDILSKEEGN